MEKFEGQLKFVFAGEVGVGKTTAISTITDDEVMTMDVPLTEATEVEGKLTTTVGFDFTILQLSDTPVYLYGTPGQDRFSGVAEVLLDGALGVVLLVNLSETDAVAKTRRWLQMIADDAPDAPIVIALNRVHRDHASLSEIRTEIAEYSSQVVAVQCADPRSRVEMLSCLRFLTLVQFDAP